MKKQFSTKWKSSKNPKKQRKYTANAPLHIKRKLLSAHLSKDLIKKHKKRNIILRKGDTVKIVRGQFKKKTGKIERVDTKKAKIYIQGIENLKKDGSKVLIPIQPSNVIVQELTIGDKIRKKILERK